MKPHDTLHPRGEWSLQMHQLYTFWTCPSHAHCSKPAQVPMDWDPPACSLLKNRTATCTLGGWTPFEIVHKSKPNLESLPEWGNTCLQASMKAGENLRNKQMRGIGQAQPWQPGPSCLLAQKASCHCWKECELLESCPNMIHGLRGGKTYLWTKTNPSHNCSTSYANTSTCTCPTHRPTNRVFKHTCWCLGCGQCTC